MKHVIEQSNISAVKPTGPFVHKGISFFEAKNKLILALVYYIYSIIKAFISYTRHLPACLPLEIYLPVQFLECHP